MDCAAFDHGIQPNRYFGSPEEGLIWYDCMPREGYEPYHYWLQVSVTGMNGGPYVTGDTTHAITFNESFTCEDDPEYMCDLL